MTELQISLIRTDGGTQSRVALNEAFVDKYADVISELPDVTVFHDGSSYWLADGFHRLAAHVKAGCETINAKVRQGTQRDAILFSVGTNETHGLNRSNEDKRCAVMKLLNDAEWKGWSNVRIARACRVSDELVRGMRPVTSNNGGDSSVTYANRQGGVSVMDTSNLGRGRRASTSSR